MGIKVGINMPKDSADISIGSLREYMKMQDEIRSYLKIKLKGRK